ncbi:hypothetical protein KIH86_03555 [Paenibacillus sp. HN-1]|uniref:hypothetical protein n=1 Tax=Paenibacillus TaxID=44249 RepID=UPI001CA8E956|nr:MULTISPECIES: hypothetical protein [Paenibacillus]MBY9077258.1 hypothetical protein [Paenibacillus sp. CGMCC 1.18879]MBY9083305.1 hypothetical protein [Paenibacillus sinensis]
MDLSARETADQIRELMRHIKDQFDANAETIAFCDGEAIDLYHALEFIDEQRAEELGLTQQFRENRRRRRAAKDDNELWLPLYEMVTDQNADLPDDINKARRRVQETARKHAGRRYTVKTREDLQAEFDRSNRGKKGVEGLNSH